MNNLANLLYENIPEDRFVKASIVLEDNSLFDIAVRPLCNSIDEISSQNEQKFKLSILEDTLSDAQKEKFVYIPIKKRVQFKSRLCQRTFFKRNYVDDFCINKYRYIFFVR